MHLLPNGGIHHLLQLALYDQINENVSFLLGLWEGRLSLTWINTVDDRFDPYPSSSKRRAVSPSISYFREAHGSLHTRNSGTPRLSIPVAAPVSTVNSATSSPTVCTYPTSSIPGARNGSIGQMSVSSSPTMRSSMGLASPVIRPVPRPKRGEGEEREVAGAGEAVGGLTLG